MVCLKGRCTYFKSRNNNKTKVKTVPYLFGLFCFRHFSSTSACSVSVGCTFLSHLSRRLTGELIGYPWIRRPSSSSSVRPSVHIFKHLLLRNRLANQSQILCGASLESGNESLYKWSRSHDQDGRHAHIW